MIRAVFFDFYSVWTPDKIGYYLAYAQIMSPTIYKELCDATEKYYQGDMSIDNLTNMFRVKLGANDIGSETFKISAASISPAIADFMRSLHGHSVKVGVFGNLGHQEYEALKTFNEASQAMEIVASPYSLSLKKPLLDEEVFNKTFATIKEPAEYCLIISGNPYYLAFARALGVQTLQFDGLKTLENTLNQLLLQDLPTTTNTNV
jgi:FMN phosphatase YigB (HAD superfamily)